MRRPSIVTTAMVPVLLGLVGNLATGTVKVPDGWTWSVWAATGVLGVGMVAIEVRRNRVVHLVTSVGSGIDLHTAGDQLAVALASQWQREEERRRVHDPYPLPVRWHAAPDALTDHWANIRQISSSAETAPVPLDGQLDDIVDIYRRIPSGRLVVLGRAGSGKTILATRFARGLLDIRTGSGPIPVIFSIASWDPATTPLRTWLAQQLVRDHAGLAAPTTTGESAATALVDSGRILPVLDGFDEIADGLHRAAIEGMNTTTMPILLTSRPLEYAAAVAAGDVLTAAAGIELDDLTIDDLAEYLPRTTRKTTYDRSRAVPAWEPVLVHLHDDPTSHSATTLTTVLTTPLMVMLARTVYSDSPDRNPADLLNTDQFDTAQTMEAHLVEAFLPAVYNAAADYPSARRFSRSDDLERIRRWLGYLAWHAQCHGNPDIAWWNLGNTIPRTARALAVGVGCGIAGAFVGGPLVGLVFGLVMLFVFGFESQRPEPSRTRLRFRGRGKEVLRAVTGALLVGTTGGLLLGVVGGSTVGAIFGIVFGLAFGLSGGHTFGLAVGHAFGLETPIDIRASVSPDELLIADRKNTVIKTLIFGPVIAGAFGVAFGPVFGIIFGTLFGLSFMFSTSAWGQWLILSRLWLPLTRRLPWAVLTFLRDAHRRGILRQTGAVYQFRHARLQDHLAMSYQTNVA